MSENPRTFPILKMDATRGDKLPFQSNAGGDQAVPLAWPRVKGKFFFRGESKFFIAGVTYGPFGSEGDEEYRLEDVERDFARIAATSMNSVRLYTIPPRWLLDAAERHGLYVLVGLPWEQHVAFLQDRQRTRSIIQRTKLGVRSCAGHPAVLGYTIGNEIPASVIRWHGREEVESFLQALCRAVRSEDPGALTTYVNYPTTEYLRLGFVDLQLVSGHFVVGAAFGEEVLVSSGTT